MSNNEVEDYASSSSLQNNQNSAFVVPYISNAYSPSRPRRKQKINREQNRDTNSSVSNLEADNNIIQAAAMARAVANNSAAIIGSQSNAINDLNFYPVDSTVLPYVPNPLSNYAHNPNISATVHPIPHQPNSLSTHQNNENTEEVRNNTRRPSVTLVRNQQLTDVSDVSRITRSIFGHINNLISQTDADPDQLQKLLESIQTARIRETPIIAGPGRALEDHETSQVLRHDEPKNVPIQACIPKSNAHRFEGARNSLAMSSNDNVEAENQNTSYNALNDASTNEQIRDGAAAICNPNINDEAKEMHSNSFAESIQVQPRENGEIEPIANIGPPPDAHLSPAGKWSF